MILSEKLKSILFCWLPLILYLTLIFLLSHSSDPTPDTDFPINDKVMHFLEYLPLPILFFRAFLSLKKGRLFNNYFKLGILASILYAVSDEIHQSFIPLRDSSVFDFFANCGGILLGAFLFRRFLSEILRP